MSPIRRCHVCGGHFRPSSGRRHGQVRCRHRADPDAALPDPAFVCADCRDEVIALTRHWEPREPMGGTCSFCERSAANTGLVVLTSVVVDRVVSRGAYLLCGDCEGVFATFLADLHAGVDLPAAWTHTPSAAAVFDRSDDDLRVETTPPTDPEPRLRLLQGSTPVVEAVPDAAPRELAREFVAAFEAFYSETGDDPRQLGIAVVDGNPGLRAAPQ
ncbi:MAG: hypothetical protein ABEJ73_11065 [Haloplanus sp.]